MEHADVNSSKAVVILVLICGTNQTSMILLHCRTKGEDVEGDHGAAAPICRDCSKIFFRVVFWYRPRAVVPVPKTFQPYQ